ncbi:MAG TPA: inositol monophosphatase family protein, partial [Kiritimatiellia bacterium]|nr:inositol monophosphatase family protein [Kiritimatiellia bacterium]
MEKLAPLDRFTALDVAGSAVAEAGRLLLELSQKPIEVLCEPGHDIKLRADQLAEERILSVLKERLPLPVLTEESGEHGAVAETSRMWIVDPLDGTFNYSRGMPMCCSSVGLWENGQPVLGAVYNFFNDELFAGIVG